MEIYPETISTIRKAEEISGSPVSYLLQEADEEELGKAENTHPALFVYSVALYEIAKKHATPDVVFGHSLGEFAALYAAGVLDFETALKLVMERGRLISKGIRKEGRMVALIGENVLRFAEEVLKIVRSKTLTIANYNSPKQVVISGHSIEVEKAVEFLQKKTRRLGARLRAIRLKVSFASHSPVVEEVAKRFANYIDDMRFFEPKTPIIMGTTGKIARSSNEIREILKIQMARSVRFTDVIREALRLGVVKMWEIGPKRVLSSLVAQITDHIETLAFDPRYGTHYLSEETS